MTRLNQPSGRPGLGADRSRIALFQALNLGDFLCSTPALRAIRTRFPGSEITFIGKSWAEDFLARFSLVDRFEPFPGFSGIAESPEGDTELDRTWPQFGLAIQMHGSGQVSNGFVATLGAKESAGFGPSGDQRLTRVMDWVESEPEPLRWLRLAEAIGAPAAGYQTELPITSVEYAAAIALLGSANGPSVIGLHVGASNPDRRWPPDAFARLADQLAERTQAKIVLTGSDQERVPTSSVKRTMDTPAIDLAGRTDLGQFAAVIASLDLLVTNDTGASHVAAATRTPSVVLFGPTRPDRWAPLDRKRHRVIDATKCPGAPAEGAAALRELSVDHVLAECLTALAAAETPSRRFSEQERVAWLG